jgi:hypothetical protein
MTYAKPEVLLETVASIAVQHTGKGNSSVDIPTVSESNAAAYEADE